MNNIFKQIKQIFIDNKEYFIKCTLMSIIAALILGLAIGLSVPVSAAEEPTESDSVIIPAGTYMWNDILTLPSSQTSTVSIPIQFTSTFSPTPSELSIINDYLLSENLPELSYDSYLFTFTYDSIDYAVTYQFDDIITFSLGYNLVSSSVFPDDDYALSIADYFITPNEVYFWDNLGNPSLWNAEYYFKTLTLPYDTTFTDSDGIAFAHWFLANTKPVNIITAGTYFGVENPSTGSFNVSFSFTSDSYDFDTFYVGTDYITYRKLTGDARSVNVFDFASDLWSINYETITVPTDQTLPADFVTWFNSNYTTQVTPDPEPTYTIEAGYYKVRDSWNTSGWSVTNDSIEFRYYDELDQSYIEAEGIAFLIENRDMVSIWYMDDNVYLDGWNIEGAKFIEVTQDITVEPEFYAVFNNIYEISSQASNEFDSGYAAGYQDGRDVGYDIGYRQGYAQGLEDGDTNIFVDIIGGTLAAVDSFTIFGGFSLLDLISTLLGGMALVWILKLLAGG